MKALVKSQSDVGIWMQQVPDPDMGINDGRMGAKNDSSADGGGP